MLCEIIYGKHGTHADFTAVRQTRPSLDVPLAVATHCAGRLPCCPPAWHYVL